MAKGISLHIGLNEVDPAHYGGWSGPLAACEADAQDMQQLAGSYESSLLLTRKATRAAVKKGIEAAAATLRKGDIFFLTYSGHGGQVRDENNDEDDGEDETWCLYDGQLIDDELGLLWTKFAPGVRVLVLSDSCHSGTATRAHYDRLLATRAIEAPLTTTGASEAPRFRAMPREAALRTWRLNRDFYRRIQDEIPAKLPEIPATVRLISGCQDNQLSQDGTFNGLFTGTLLSVWSDGRFEGDYARFHKSIVRKMPPVQTPNHYVIGAHDAAYDAQTPFTV